jgi:hypothetical protein
MCRAPESETKKYFPVNPIFFALMFFYVWLGCLLSCLPYFLLFALWCNFMPNILSVAHSYCFLKCLYVVAICQQIMAISDQSPMSSQKYVKKTCFPTYSIWLFSDMKAELHIFLFFVMFKIDQKNADQLEKFDWNFFQLHFDSRRPFSFFEILWIIVSLLKKGFTLLLVHIFERGVDVLQKNNLLYKPPSAYEL